ncbi:MAG TPA: hypothetical protein VGL77_05415, partial [Armatimonadota bacterium]
PVGKPFTVSAGITNGSFLDTQADENSHKNFVGRVGYNLLGGQIGASVYRGHSPNGLVMNRTGLDLEINRGPLLIQGEAAQGYGRMSTATVPTFVNAESRGAYLTFAYQKAGSPRQPYLRLDTYDPDVDSANDNYRRATVGYNYYLTGNTKLTVEYQAIQDELRPNVDGNIGAQYQVSF